MTAQPVQVDDPRKLARGERWSYTCLICRLVTQGGRGGLAPHQAVVHGIGQGGGPATRRFRP